MNDLKKRCDYIPLGDCEICSKLGDIEASLTKHGWDHLSYSLPEEAWRLEPAEPTDMPDKEHDHVRHCPVCGVFYHYHWSYEYLAGGSEDSEELTRLTPTQAKSYMSADEYAFLIEKMGELVDDPNVKTRGYAVRCLVSHELAQHSQRILPFLMSPDREVVKSALSFLNHSTREGEWVSELTDLTGILQDLAQGDDREIASSAGVLLRTLQG